MALENGTVLAIIEFMEVQKGRPRFTRDGKYPVVDGKIAIEIRVNDLKQLFDERDPAPFREKDLDDDAIDYVVSSIQDVSIEKVGKLLIFVAKGAWSTSQEEDTRRAIHQFFTYQGEREAKRIRATLKVGVKSLMIGLCFLTCAIFVSMLIPEHAKSFWPLFAKEGIFLTGWVSMWKPVNIFLYEWWPLSDLRKVYICLSDIKIEFIVDPHTAVPLEEKVWG